MYAQVDALSLVRIIIGPCYFATAKRYSWVLSSFLFLDIIIRYIAPGGALIGASPKPLLILRMAAAVVRR